MNARPPDGSDEPEAVDQVMLAVLSNRGRDATLLSAEQERLLDDWVAGRLTPDDAERVIQNTDAVGFVGASSLERMGVEESLTGLTRRFKSLKVRARNGRKGK